ncbi:MAG: hypothetical protein DMF97_17800 [Acidobacteria bacterium]|nr:MAG: hypothetical protein DMF97_17800 [Acidobacteriota bacterium]
MSDENGVTEAFLQASPRTIRLHPEPPSTKPPFKLAIGSGGPDCQHSAGPERRAGDGNTLAVVQAGVRRSGQGDRAVVHIKEHGIEAAAIRSHRGANVTLLDAHAWIVQRMFRQRSERTVVPHQDGGNELGDHDACSRRKNVECRAKRKTHAEAANKHPGSRERPRVIAAQHGERVLRAVTAARHQTLAIGEDEVLTRVTDQRQLGAVECTCPSEDFPGLHARPNLRSVTPRNCW